MSDYPLVRLGEIVKIVQDRVADRSKWNFDKYMAGEHIDSGEVRIKKYGLIKGNEEVIGPAFHMRFKPGHVLYSTRRAYLRKAGMVDFEGVCSNVTLVLQANEEKLLQSLLPFILQSEEFVQFAISRSIGSTNPFVKWSDIKKYRIRLPPINTQRKLSHMLWSIENNIERTENLIQASEKLKTGLLEELLIKGIGHKKFKKTELGEMPEEWNTIALGDKKYFELRTGGTPSTSNPEYWKGGVPWLTSGELNRKRIFYTEKEISKEGFNNSNATFIPINSSLIALAGQGKTRGTVAINKMELTTNQSVAAIIPKQELYDALFLYHFLDSKYDYLRRISGGTGRAGLSLRILSDIEVPLPSLSEQSKIARILDMVDSSITNFDEHRLRLKRLKTKLVNLLLSGELLLTEIEPK